MTKVSSTRRLGFSLVEVVIATAVFATSIVAIIGLMTPLSKRVEDIIDSETAGRLAESIQAELNRIGFSTAADLINVAGGGSTIRLVADAPGTRVRLLDGAPVPADASLDDSTLPGIAQRDRYFLIILTPQSPFSASSSALALRASVVWPFQVPSGPASATNLTNVDPFEVVPVSNRQTLTYFFALRP